MLSLFFPLLLIYAATGCEHWNKTLCDKHNCSWCDTTITEHCVEIPEECESKKSTARTALILALAALVLLMVLLVLYLIFRLLQWHDSRRNRDYRGLNTEDNIEV